MSNAYNNDRALDFDIKKQQGIDKILEEKDSLQTQIYSRALFEFIQECDSPMTIGIQGDWGIGKTSMMNMVKAWIDAANNKENKYGIIWFNTWQFSLFGADEYLGLAALNELLENVRSNFDVKESQDTWRKVKGLISSLSISVMGVTIEGKGAAEDEPTKNYEDLSKVMKEFKSAFEKLVNHIISVNKLDRIVFFIDDLDRVKPLKALELLESLKNFMDVPNCVFVLAVDYEVVQMGMRQKFGVDLQKQSGKSFFDKIIQLPFTMPSASYNLKEFIQKLISNIQEIKEIKDSQYEIITEITRLTVGSNPRSIKRVVNYISLIVKLNRRESQKNETAKFNQNEIPILFAIVCMQVAWPEIFNYFLARPTPDRIRQIEDWDYLDKIPSIQKLYDRTPNVDNLKSNISGFFDLFFDMVDVGGGKNGEKDGIISKTEFEPVIKVLKKVRYLSANDEYNEAIDDFIKMVSDNNGQKEMKFLDSVYRRSSWHTSNEIEIKISGKRYSTLVYKRKQIGSLVSMKTEPLLFRLNIDHYKIQESLNNSDFSEFKDLVAPMDDLSKSGFGKTMINVKQLMGMEEGKAAQILEIIYACL